MTFGGHRTIALLWALFLMLNLAISAKTVADGTVLDIEYGTFDKSALLLDAYIPTGQGEHPVVVLVHGGGWIGGDKQDMAFLAKPLTEAGFTCFSVGYRLAPAHRWPACLSDVGAAVCWVKDHAQDYKGDPKRIALLGYSAGGHLACMAAM